MTGYTRVDSVNNIADGNIINASDLDGEFDGLVAAFNASTGHVHDGSAANGAPITKVGPSQDVVVSATTVLPKTTATVDIGSSSLKFKDFFFSGAGSVTGTITAGGFAGPINGTVGATTAAAGAFTTLSASSTVSGTGFSTYLASPPAIGGTAAAAGAFTTLSASSTVSGTGFSTYLASPPAIGGTAPAAGKFTGITNTGLTSGRVVYSTTGGLETDSANLLYSGTDLTVYGLTVGRGAGAVAGNTVVGASAGASNTTGAITAFGDRALTSNTTGASSVAFGAEAARSVTTGNYNSAFGANALFTNTTGAQNVAIGGSALYSNTTANNNIAIGYQTAYTNSTGTSLVAVGFNAMFSNTTGSSNTGLGHQSLFSNTTASNNTAVGYQAGYSNTTGGLQTYLGYQAGYSNSTGDSNIAIGWQSLYSNTGSANIAIGTYIGGNNAALYANTTGTSNIALGHASLKANTTGSYNTSVGTFSLAANTTASNNTAVGYQAMYANTTGTYNTAVGYGALDANTTGLSNNAFGFDALGGVTTGSQNNGFGVDALKGVTTGTYNTAIGHGSGSSITTGGKNTIIGAYTGSAAPISATGSNYIVLSDGDGNVRQTIDSSGNVGIGTTSPAQKLDVIGGKIGFGSTANSDKIYLYSTVYGFGIDSGDLVSFTNTTAGFSWKQGNYGGTTYMRLDGSGNLGIGTSSPSTYVNSQGVTLVVGGNGANFATIQGRTDGPSGGSNGVSFGGSYSTNPINGARITFNAEGGSGQRGSVSFWTKVLDDNSTQPLERMRIDSSGNVGIGTSSPGYKLDVQSTASSGAPLLANFQSAGGDTQVYVQNGTVKTQLTADNTNSASIVGSFSAHPLSFRTSNTERAKIDTSGVLFFNSGYGSVAKAYGCRAWCQYNNSQAIVGSANISSITSLGTGDIRLNFTTAMPDANYSAVASTNEDSGTAKFCNVTQPSTTDIRVVTYTIVGTTTNNTYNFVSIFR